MNQEFVKWSSSDESGKFDHIGQVINRTDKSVTLLLSTGSTMNIPVDDGEFKSIKQPKDWSLSKPEKDQPKSIKKSTTTSTKKSTGETKKDKAVAIYKEMMNGSTHPTRKDVINRFMTELDMTINGASTYQYNIKKELS